MLGQSALKHYNKLFIIKFPHFKQLILTLWSTLAWNIASRLKNVSVLFLLTLYVVSVGKGDYPQRRLQMTWMDVVFLPFEFCLLDKMGKVNYDKSANLVIGLSIGPKPK